MDWSAYFDQDQVREVVSTQVPIILGSFVISLAILIAAFVLGRFAAALATRPLQRQRGGTLVPIVRKGIHVLAILLGVMMALDNLGLDVKTLLAGAGILGLAIGFGAQGLVKDLIAGFFILLEDVLRVGDIAAVGATVGVVEEVGLRLTQVRSLNGQLWYIANGEIAQVGNFNRTWSRAIVEVSVAYEQEVGRGMQVLQEVGDAWAAENPDLVLEPPVAQGLLGLNATSVTIRLMAKVLPNELFAAERALRVRVKEAFDAQGVEIPFPRQVVYHRQEEHLPALRLLDAGAPTPEDPR